MGDMDSGNSGSLQSSSTGGGGGGGGGGGSGCGDDQEYDSRGGGGGGSESISAFFNPMSNFNNSNMGGAVPLQLYSFSNGSSSFAHQVSNYFDHPPPTNFIINHNNNYNNNQLDMVWPNKFGSIRPSILTDDANCTTLGYNISNNNQQQQNPSRPLSTPLPTPGPPAPRFSSIPTSTGSVRNPKKRSRASRRAPTTVLTTDTNNFRQMVQEFTGIPASPFAAFSTRARFDLFGGLGGHSSSVVPPPSYLLRPSPQKIPPLYQPPYLANSSLPSHTTTNTTINNNNSGALVDGLGLAASSTSSASTSISTTIATPASTTFHMCDPREFLSTNPQHTFQSLLQSTSSVLADHQNSSTSLGCTTVTPHQTSCSVNPAGENCYRGISSTNAAATSDNNGGATKGEGMVESWICSSD